MSNDQYADIVTAYEAAEAAKDTSLEARDRWLELGPKYRAALVGRLEAKPKIVYYHTTMEYGDPNLAGRFERGVDERLL